MTTPPFARQAPQPRVRQLRPLLVLAVVASVLCALAPRRACAAPPSGFGTDPTDSATEEAFDDGEIDADDIVSRGASRRALARPNARVAPTWLSIGGFGSVRNDALHEVGIVVVLGFPLDRVVAPPPSTRLRPHFFGEGPAAVPSPSAPVVVSTPVTPRLARGAVAAAFRASGIAADDAVLDAFAARARLAGLLPETRLRALRTQDQSAKVDSLSDVQRTTDSAGANLWLEARLTWRLDRLVYSDDEPQLERLRADRVEARARIASKVLELLFRWQRAIVDTHQTLPTSPEGVEAALRVAEAEVALDVVTAGWFGATLAKRPIQ